MTLPGIAVDSPTYVGFVPSLVHLTTLSFFNPILDKVENSKIRARALHERRDG